MKAALCSWMLMMPIASAAQSLLNPLPWVYDGGQPNAILGRSVASAGDVNGDGYDDILVGASEWDGFFSNEGRALLFLGSATGPSNTPDWSAYGNQGDSSFGHAVACAGDVNGDGFDDVVVGAYRFDLLNADEGAAFVYLGSPTGLALSPVWTMVSFQPNAAFGRSVAGAGDVNGDGYDDVLIGASQFANGQANEGRAYIFLGSASGPATTAWWTAESDWANAQFGGSVSSAGDVNGDGLADIVIGADAYTNGQSVEGKAYVFLGDPNAMSTTPAWSIESNAAQARFGRSVAGAGDVNGDGYADVVAGAPGYNNGNGNDGRAFVYIGGPTGLALTPLWQFINHGTGLAQFGGSVACAGDVNRDGYADMVVGEKDYESGQSREGRALVFAGAPSGPYLNPVWTYEPNVADAEAGNSVAGAGDVNGDGWPDVLVGVSSWSSGIFNQGRVLLFFGNAPSQPGAPFCTIESIGVDHSTSCPCGNGGTRTSGCAHSFGTGARMKATGQSASDTVVLAASEEPATSFTLFMQHDAPDDRVFHDGVICAGGSLVRLRGRAAVAGESSFPNSAFAQDQTITLSQRGAVFPGQGVRRYYAAWYRNAATTFCPPATANVSNGWIIDW